MSFVTTVVGSFPSVPSKARLAESYREGTDPFISSLEDAVRCQSDAGIDIISDGQTRNDMIALFTSKLGGIRMRARPVVIGDIEFKAPIMKRDLEHANKLAGGNAEVKGIVTGPYTLAKSCIDEHYGSVETLAMAFAEALSSEVAAISEVVDIVQIDEPFFSVEYPEYAGSLADTVFGNSGVERALHVCGDVSRIFEKLVELKVDILDHEFAAQPSLSDAIAGYDFPQALGYGCVRSDTAVVESPEEIVERIKKGLDLFGEKRLLIDPDCGLRNMDRDSASQKLNNMVKAKEEFD